MQRCHNRKPVNVVEGITQFPLTARQREQWKLPGE